MSRPLEVLLIESHRGAGEATARTLDAAGHRVRRCHDHHSTGFPCRGVVDADDCPLEHATDVALVVRRPGTPEPTPLEQGVSCAVRAGVPVVEVGPDGTADPFGPWLAARIDDHAEAAAAAEAAADAALDSVRRAVLTLTGPLLADAGIDPHAVTCTVASEATRLHVQVDLPVAVDESVKQAVAVRALAALRDPRRTHSSVGVAVNCLG